MSEYLSFYVQRYFMSYLMKQHNYGANTISSYRDTFRLLLAFMAESHPEIIRQLESAKTLDEELEAQIVAAAGEFKKQYQEK